MKIGIHHISHTSDLPSIFMLFIANLLDFQVLLQQFIIQQYRSQLLVIRYLHILLSTQISIIIQQLFSQTKYSLMPIFKVQSQAFKEIKSYLETTIFSELTSRQISQALLRCLNWMDNTNQQNLMWYASLLTFMNKRDKAENIIKQLYAKGFYHVQNNRRYAELLVRKNKIQKARNVLEETLQKSYQVEKERTLFIYGKIEHDLRNYDLALQILPRFSKHDQPEQQREELQLNLHSKILFQLGQKEHSLNLLKILLSRQQVTCKQVYHQRVAFILISQGKFEQAKKYCQFSLKQDAKDGQANYHLARAFFKLSQTKQACQQMKQAVRKSPQDLINNLHKCIYQSIWVLQQPKTDHNQYAEQILQIRQSLDVVIKLVEEPLVKIIDNISHYWFTQQEVIFLKQQIIQCFKLYGYLDKKNPDFIDYFMAFDEYLTENTKQREQKKPKLIKKMQWIVKKIDQSKENPQKFYKGWETKMK